MKKDVGVTVVLWILCLTAIGGIIHIIVGYSTGQVFNPLAELTVILSLGFAALIQSVRDGIGEVLAKQDEVINATRKGAALVVDALGEGEKV